MGKGMKYFHFLNSQLWKSIQLSSQSSLFWKLSSPDFDEILNNLLFGTELEETSAGNCPQRARLLALGVRIKLYDMIIDFSERDKTAYYYLVDQK